MFQNPVFDESHLLGVRYHKVTTDELLAYILYHARGPGKVVVANVNVRALNIAYELPWYKEFLNSSDLVFCDGFGVAAASKLLGNDVRAEHRTTCPDWIETLAHDCADQNRSLFLLGGKPGVALGAADRMRAGSPELRVRGHHGYFDPLGTENDDVVAMINDFQPDVLYVGLGMPLQERWILDNRDRLKAHVFLPLGACLDFYTEFTSRGPKWMTDNGLEWLSRLLTEPSRLWGRYIIGNPLFFWRVLKLRCGWLQLK